MLNSAVKQCNDSCVEEGDFFPGPPPWCGLVLRRQERKKKSKRRRGISVGGSETFSERI